jgi:hypothetical protein
MIDIIGNMRPTETKKVKNDNLFPFFDSGFARARCDNINKLGCSILDNDFSKLQHFQISPQSLGSSPTPKSTEAQT